MFVEGRIKIIAPLKKNRNFAKTMAVAKVGRWKNGYKKKQNTEIRYGGDKGPHIL